MCDHHTDRDMFLSISEILLYMMQRAPDSVNVLAKFGIEDATRDNFIAADSADVMIIERCLEMMKMMTSDDYDSKARVGTRAVCQKLVDLLSVYPKDITMLWRICSCVNGFAELSSTINYFRDAKLPERIPAVLQTLSDMWGQSGDR